MRAHLGVETQRQWSHTAIARTTPCLFALFSIVTLLAARPRATNGNDRSRRVVPQVAPDLRRCSRCRALCDQARADFDNIITPTPLNTIPLPLARALGLFALPSRMNGQS